MGHTHVGVGQRGGEQHRHEHHGAGRQGLVEEHHHEEDQDEHQWQHPQVGFIGRFVHSCGNTDGAARQTDLQTFNFAFVGFDPLFCCVNRTADGLALVILVVEHQIGDTLIRIHEFVQRTRDRAGHHVGEHQTTHIHLVVRDLSPAWIVVMQQTVHLFHQIRDAFGAPHFRVQQHVLLQIAQGTQYLWAFDATFLIRFGNDVQFFRTWEAVVHRFG